MSNNIIPKTKVQYLNIPLEILRIHELNPLDKMILGYVNGWKFNDNEFTYASYDYIAWYLGVSRSGVIKSVNKLIEMGLINKIKPYGPQGRRKILSSSNETIQEKTDRTPWKTQSDSTQSEPASIQSRPGLVHQVDHISPQSELYNIPNNIENNLFGSTTTANWEFADDLKSPQIKQKLNSFVYLDEDNNIFDLVEDGWDWLRNSLGIAGLEKVKNSIMNKQLNEKVVYEDSKHFINGLLWDIKRIVSTKAMMNSEGFSTSDQTECYNYLDEYDQKLPF